LEGFLGVGVGGLGGRTDLSVNLLELVLDPCELLVGDHGDLFGLVGHFGCVVWLVKSCCVWVYGMVIWRKESANIRLVKKKSRRVLITQTIDRSTRR
jgi:hypothetical protein